MVKIHSPAKVWYLRSQLLLGGNIILSRKSLPTACGFYICMTLILHLCTNEAVAAGFDCTKKLTRVEKLICSNARLSSLDEELNKSYRLALKTSSHKKSLIRWNRNWLKTRNQCKDNICIYWSYLSELGHIQALSDIDKDNFSCNTNKTICNNKDSTLLLEEYDVAFNYINGNAEFWSAFATSHIQWIDSVRSRCLEDKCILDAIKDRTLALWNTSLETPMPLYEQGKYSLIDGGESICKDLIDNLNRFSYPMRCELQVHPNHSDKFKLPSYSRLDTQDTANENLFIRLLSGNRTIHWAVNDSAVEYAKKSLQRLRILQLRRPSLGARYEIYRAPHNDEGNAFFIIKISKQPCQPDNPTISNAPDIVYLDANLNIYTEGTDPGYFPESGTIFLYGEKQFIFTPTGLDYVVRRIHKLDSGAITSKGAPLCYFSYKPFPLLRP